jgi:hypothetical protein
MTRSEPDPTRPIDTPNILLSLCNQKSPMTRQFLLLILIAICLTIVIREEIYLKKYILIFHSYIIHVCF